MTPEQITYMTKSGMLFLDKNRRKSHFGPSSVLKTAAFIPVILFFFFIIRDGFEKLITLIIVCSVISSVFLLASSFVFKSQQRKLILTPFRTSFAKADNYIIAKKTLEALQWIVKEDSLDFIEAYNPQRDIRTWGDEMISLVLLDNEILINSICNLVYRNQSFFTFGKNQENIARFKEMFQLISQKEKHSA